MKKQLIKVVDENESEVGALEKEEVHKKGLWHQVVLVWVINKKNQVLIQRRSQSGDVIQGLWDHSCAGHVDQGENPEIAAIRELREELGVGGEVQFVTKYKIQEQSSARVLNRFWYIYFLVHDGPFRLERNEVAEVKFVEYDWLVKEIETNGERYTSEIKHTINSLSRVL